MAIILPFLSMLLHPPFTATALQGVLVDEDIAIAAALEQSAKEAGTGVLDQPKHRMKGPSTQQPASHPTSLSLPIHKVSGCQRKVYNKLQRRHCTAVCSPFVLCNTHSHHRACQADTTESHASCL